MNFDSFFSDVIATVLGGIILAVLFFWSREKLFSLSNITGQWYFEVQTTKTVNNPYMGMKLRYVAILWQEGPHIKGTTEKIYEISSTGEREYIGEARTRGYVEGFLEKKYFSEDRLALHIIEDGKNRESTNFHDVLIQSNKRMTGVFSSMIADQEGDVIWQRNRF